MQCDAEWLSNGTRRIVDRTDHKEMYGVGIVLKREMPTGKSSRFVYLTNEDARAEDLW